MLYSYSVGFSDFNSTYIYLNFFVGEYFLWVTHNAFFQKYGDSTAVGCGDNIINKIHKKNHRSLSFIYYRSRMYLRELPTCAKKN